MTLSEWRDRLALMSRSSICHLEPHEAADLLRAIDFPRDAQGVVERTWKLDVEPDEALPERKTGNEGAW